MPLESLGKGKLNIKGIETPDIKDGVENLFDPEAEMDQEQYESIIAHLNDFRDHQGKITMRSIGSIASPSYLVKTFPKRRDDSKLQDPSLIKNIETTVRATIQTDSELNDAELIKAAAALRFLFPNRPLESFGYDDACRERLLRRAESLKLEANIPYAAEGVANLVIAFPEKRSQMHVLNTLVPKIKEQLAGLNKEK
jgi:hypothetical protein